MVDRIGTLQLRRVLSVAQDGTVVLAGTNAHVLSAGALSPNHVGRTAICQDARDESRPVTVDSSGRLRLLAGRIDLN